MGGGVANLMAKNGQKLIRIVDLAGRNHEEYFVG
jgi:hypothetical protein